MWHPRFEPAEPQWTIPRDHVPSIASGETIQCLRCVVCDAPASWRCAQCHVTKYCSRACQKRDWGKRHKSFCSDVLEVRAENWEAKEDLAATETARPVALACAEEGEANLSWLDDTDSDDTATGPTGEEAVPRNVKSMLLRTMFPPELAGVLASSQCEQEVGIAPLSSLCPQRY